MDKGDNSINSSGNKIKIKRFLGLKVKFQGHQDEKYRIHHMCMMQRISPIHYQFTLLKNKKHKMKIIFNKIIFLFKYCESSKVFRCYQFNRFM